MNSIGITSLTRRFGNSAAVREVTLGVPEGSICGLLGRNGAGKTTIMSIVAGQDRPTSGRVEVFGERPFENESVLSKISFVRDNQRYPDNYRLHHVLRIAPDFAPNWSSELADELAEGFRIPRTTRISKFSRGQLSSVAIVLGLASRSPVTLLDEPYLGLDVTARALFHHVLLRDYSAHPRTVVLSTHLIEESEALLDRVVIMDRGRVRVETGADEIAELAFTLSGTAEAVDRLSAGFTVLLTRSVAGLRAVTLEGALTPDTIAEADRLGVQAARASLHEVVGAVGAEREEQADHAERPTQASIRKGAHS